MLLAASAFLLVIFADFVAGTENGKSGLFFRIKTVVSNVLTGRAAIQEMKIAQLNHADALGIAEETPLPRHRATRNPPTKGSPGRSPQPTENRGTTIDSEIASPAPSASQTESIPYLRPIVIPTPTNGSQVDEHGNYFTKHNKLDTDGLNIFADAEELARNQQAIEEAVRKSPYAIAVVVGNHAGGPSKLGGGFDHAFVAYKSPIGQIEILEMMPGPGDLKGTIGSPNPAPRKLPTIARDYDEITASPLLGITREQANNFLENMKDLTKNGTIYSMIDSEDDPIVGQRGETCSSVIGEAFSKAGIPNTITSNGDLNFVSPGEVLEFVNKINRDSRDKKNDATNLPTSP